MKAKLSASLILNATLELAFGSVKSASPDNLEEPKPQFLNRKRYMSLLKLSAFIFSAMFLMNIPYLTGCEGTILEDSTPDSNYLQFFLCEKISEANQLLLMDEDLLAVSLYNSDSRK